MKWLRIDFRQAGRDVPIATNDSFRFSLPDSVSRSSHQRHCSTVEILSHPRSTPQCADCLVAAVVHYNLSSIVGTATYTSYPATCAGTTCLYLRVPWAEVIRGPPCVSLFNDKERREQKGSRGFFCAWARGEPMCPRVVRQVWSHRPNT